MMSEKLRVKAEKIVAAKEGFYICSIVFSCITVVLLILSFYTSGIAIWLLMPVPIFIMILGIVYISAFGIPFSETTSADWREEEIEREMARMSLEKRARERPVEEPAKSPNLELKELETLESSASANDEDYV